MYSCQVSTFCHSCVSHDFTQKTLLALSLAPPSKLSSFLSLLCHKELNHTTLSLRTPALFYKFNVLRIDHIEMTNVEPIGPNWSISRSKRFWYSTQISTCHVPRVKKKTITPWTWSGWRFAARHLHVWLLDSPLLYRHRHYLSVTISGAGGVGRVGAREREAEIKGGTSPSWVEFNKRSTKEKKNPAIVWRKTTTNHKCNNPARIVRRCGASTAWLGLGREGRRRKRWRRRGGGGQQTVRNGTG